MTLPNKINVFHFPKAGGKSVRHQLQQNTSTLLYYNNPFNSSPLKCYFSEVKFKVKYRFNRPYEKRKWISYGHFAYKNRFFKDENAANIIMLRHPTDWAASMYFYWKNKYTVNLNLIEFIDQYNLVDVYKRFVGSYDASNFTHIFRFEEYNRYIATLSDLTGIQIVNITKNATSHKPDNYLTFLSENHMLENIKHKFHDSITFYENLK